MKKLTINIQVLTKDMFSFVMHHAYTRFSGLFGILLSLGALLLLCLNYKEYDDTRIVMMAVIAALFTVVNPLMLLMKAKRQVLMNPVYKNGLTYMLSEEGIEIIQGEQKASLEWKHVMRVTEYRNEIFVYTSGVNAFIIPKRCLDGQQLTELRQIMSKYLTDLGLKLPKTMRGLL